MFSIQKGFEYYIYLFLSHFKLFMRFWKYCLFLRTILWLELIICSAHYKNLERLYLFFLVRIRKNGRGTKSFPERLKYIYKSKTYSVYMNLRKSGTLSQKTEFFMFVSFWDSIRMCPNCDTLYIESERKYWRNSLLKWNK